MQFAGAPRLPLPELNTLALGDQREMRVPPVPRIWGPGRDADPPIPAYLLKRHTTGSQKLLSRQRHSITLQLNLT